MLMITLTFHQKIDRQCSRLLTPVIYARIDGDLIMSMMKNVIILVCIAVASFAAGCMGAPAPTPTPTPTAAPAAPTPVPTITPTPVPADLSEWNPAVTATHYVNGSITYNGKPSGQYSVIVLTSNNNTYGAYADANGNFSVKFPDDGSTAYRLEIVNDGSEIIYLDGTPRPISQSGPLNVSIVVPGVNKMTVHIS